MNYIPKCDGLCNICKHRKTPIDGYHCDTCGNEFANFLPDWVTLICTYFHISRNQAKKIYHNMFADWRIRKEMKKMKQEYKEVFKNDNK